MARTSGLSFVVATVIAGGGYVVACSPSETGFSRIEVGENEGTVIKRMGRPQRIESRQPRLTGVAYEYEYYLWPLPKTWCVGFEAGFVVSKGVVE